MRASRAGSATRSRSAVRLVLCTATFPTGPGEAFLADELPYLADGFGRVIVVPSRLDAAAPSRPLPDGVDVDVRWAAVYGRLAPDRWRDAWAGVRTADAWADVIRRWPLTARKITLRQAMLYTRRARAFERWLHRALPAWPGTTIGYTYWLGPLTYGLARAGGRGLRFVVVSRAHGGDLFEDRYQPPYLPLRRATLRGADAVFPVSDIGRRVLLAGEPALADRITTQRLGVHDPGADARPSADGVLRIVTCAGCRPVKRLDRAVRGIADLARRPGAPAVRWDHFGDGETRAVVERLARAELPATVAWTMHGHVDAAALQRHYATSPVDVLLNTSASEGVSVALMEAQSFGIPCVATAVGGTPEIVDDGNGRLVQADATADDIATALLAFAPGSTGVAERRAASKASWRARYQAEVNYPAFIDALHAVARADGSASPVRRRPLRVGGHRG